MRSVLVTGGTGSFGRAFVERILSQHPECERVVVYSRDELKQAMMRADLVAYDARLRFFIGDVRDKERLLLAVRDVEVIVHAAALKHVDAAEYNPTEFIKTNITGTENVIHAALNTPSIKRVVALSTDKASSPVNLYGATKLCADKLISAANSLVGDRDLVLSNVRYGNVLASRGSLFWAFQVQKTEGLLKITNPEMTRFSISLHEAVEMVLFAILNSIGGETFVPQLPSYKVSDFAQAFDEKLKTVIVGSRPGEKLHEEMISKSEASLVRKIAAYYVILPADERLQKRFKDHLYTSVSGLGEGYSSDMAKRLSVSKLKSLLEKLQA